MKCRRVKKLLPLYVEGDLAPNMADRISAHLDWCGQCNWLADEYNESQTWLHTSEAPEFDQAVLDSFKSDVLRRIEETAPRPSLLAAIAQHWSRRQVLAISGAILIVIGMVVFYIYQARLSVNTQLTETAREIAVPEHTTIDEPNEKVHAQNEPSTAPSIARKHGVQQRNRKAERAKSIDKPQGPALFFQANRSNELGNPSELAIKQPDVKDDSPEMLRIEIQTADPNIRIIWFAPRIADGPQTNQ